MKVERMDVKVVAAAASSSKSPYENVVGLPQSPRTRIRTTLAKDKNSSPESTNALPATPATSAGTPKRSMSPRRIYHTSKSLASSGPAAATSSSSSSSSSGVVDAAKYPNYALITSGVAAEVSFFPLSAYFIFFFLMFIDYSVRIAAVTDNPCDNSVDLF